LIVNFLTLQTFNFTNFMDFHELLIIFLLIFILYFWNQNYKNKCNSTYFLLIFIAIILIKMNLLLKKNKTTFVICIKSNI